MNRRTLDIGIPILYVIAIVVTTLFKNETAIGAVAVVGALLVALYYGALRPRPKSKV